MLAVAHLKLAWVDDLIFFIWQVRSPATAAAFLVQFSTSQGPQHRVTLRFVAGELRHDMEAWAKGAAVSPRLRLELQSYHWCKLDDAWAEATHRGVSRIAKRVTVASQSWQYASLRLQQNLDLWDGLGTQSRARFDSMLYRWKAIGQLAPRLAFLLTRCKVSAAVVLRFVYCTGTRALEDWFTQLRDALDSGTRADVLPELSFAATLKADFLRRVLMPRQFFSLPSLADADALAALEGVTLVKADAALHKAAEGLQFLQVVGDNVRRRTMPRIEAARVCRGV